MPSSPPSDKSMAAFIPAKTWQGSKTGYYFGTTQEKGTGYHLDPHQQLGSSSSKTKSPLSALRQAKHKQVSPVDRPSAKRAKRSVMIAEDQNQIRTIPHRIDGNKLLEEAEQAAAGSKVLDLSPKGITFALTNLKKAHAKNQLLRSQHPTEPELYMESELALYEAITALQPIASDPATLYPPLYSSTKGEELWTDTLSQLCLHPNPDIASSLVALLLELLDPSLLDTTTSMTQNPTNQALLHLAQATLQHLLELIIANLNRLQQGGSGSTAANKTGTTDGQEEEDTTEDSSGIGKGVQDVLSLMENLLEMDLILQTYKNTTDETIDGKDKSMIVTLVPNNQLSVAAKLVQDTPFMPWLFQQIQNNTPSKERSLEILAFLVQQTEVHDIYPTWTELKPYKSILEEEEENDRKKDTDNDKKDTTTTTIDGMEILLLHGIAPYRKKQPENDAQVEALENAIIAVEAALAFSPAQVQAFLDAQGIELVLRCLKEKVHAGGAALKLLDFSSNIDPVYQKACEHLVAEAGGLKYFFPLLMGKQIPKPAILSWAKPTTTKNNKPSAAIVKAKKEWLHSIENQTIRILYALTRHLTDVSPLDAKQRLLAKFLDVDKCDRLVELVLAYDQKSRLAEFKFWKTTVEEEDDDEEDEVVQLAALEAKLRGGGDLFHRLGAICGFCCIGSKRCHERILSQLSLQQSGIAVVKAALEEFISVLGPGKQADQLQSYHDGI